jgi:hypothetical protein
MPGKLGKGKGGHGPQKNEDEGDDGGRARGVEGGGLTPLTAMTTQDVVSPAV